MAKKPTISAIITRSANLRPPFRRWNQICTFRREHESRQRRFSVKNVKSKEVRKGQEKQISCKAQAGQYAYFAKCKWGNGGMSLSAEILMNGVIFLPGARQRSGLSLASGNGQSSDGNEFGGFNTLIVLRA
jgi:hypothetical protein